MSESTIAEPPRTRRKKLKPEADRLPPHSIEAEQGVLGCALLSPNDCLPRSVETFRGRTDVFYDLRHQTIFEALISMLKAREQIDIITLQQHLKDEALLEQVGGIGYLDGLQDAVSSTSQLSAYLDIVQEKYQLRKIVHTCTEVVGRVYDFQGDVDLLIDRTRHDLDKVFAPRITSRCEHFTISELDKFNLDNRDDNLVGNGYMTVGSSLITNGASGRGKSSLLMYRIIRWALGLDFFGMIPVRPLSFVVFQSENNRGDSAKTFQGARNYLQLDSNLNREEFALLEKNIRFFYCPSLCDQEFLNTARQKINEQFSDIAVIDPMVSFTGEDLNSAQGATRFLRHGLGGISAETNVCWMINHHTPKPLRDPRAGKFKRNSSDSQYGGAGSFVIPSWARAVETLEEASDGVFRFTIGKRGFESQATHPGGERTSMIWLKHATEGGIHWEQCPPPPENTPDEEPRQPGGRPSKLDKLMSLGLGGVIDGLTTPVGLNELAKMIREFSEKKRVEVSLSTCKSAVALLFENSALNKTNGLYSKP